MSSTNDLCGCINEEECMIDRSCKMGDLGCNAYGKMYCRLCRGEGTDSEYLPCKWLCNSDGTCSANASGIFSSESDCLSTCSNGRGRNCLNALKNKCGRNQRKCLNRQQRDNLSYCVNYKRDYSSHGSRLAPYQCYNNGVKDIGTINNYLNSMCPQPDYSKCDCSTCMVDYGCDRMSPGCNKNGVGYCRNCGFGGYGKCMWKCNDGSCVRDASGVFGSERECLTSCDN
jgi:hypothetical protein